MSESRPGFDGLAVQVVVDIADELRGGLVAAVAVFLEALEDDALDVFADGFAELAGRGGGGGADVLQHLAHVADDLVGEAAGQDLVEDDAKGIDVGADVDHFAAALGLLGAGPGHRAEELAGDGHELEGFAVRPARGFAASDFREAKVEDVRVALAIDDDVAGLEVAVDDALEVGGADGLADLDEHAEGVVDIAPGAGLDAGHIDVQRGAGDVVHHEVGEALVGCAAVVDGDDAGVVELAQDLGLALEAGVLAAGRRRGLRA